MFFRNIMSLSGKVVTSSRHLENIAKVLCDSVMETKELSQNKNTWSYMGKQEGHLQSQRGISCV